MYTFLGGFYTGIFFIIFQESSGSEEEDDEDEEEGEAEREPVLKYERIGNAVSKLFTNDAASCMAVHSKVWSPKVWKI